MTLGWTKIMNKKGVSTLMGIYVAFVFSILSACSQSNSSDDVAYEIPKFDKDGSIEIQTKTNGILLSSESFSPANIILEVDGCASGFVTTVPASNIEAALYIGDYGCRAKVLSFTSNSGEVFTIKAGSTFGYGLGDVTPFVSNLANEANVVTGSVLSSPLLSSDTIEFSIYRLDSGNNLDLDTGENILYVSAATAEVTEGDSVKVSYTVKKVSEADSNALTVNYSLSGSASPGTDYIAPSGSVIIPAGQTEAVVEVDIINDGIGEPIETLNFTISGSPNYFSYGEGNTIIYDEDSGVPSTNLVMHLTPSSISNTAGNVDLWNDTSTFSQTIRQTVVASQPALASGVINGFDGVNFDGVDDFLAISGNVEINSTGPFTEKKIFTAFETGADVNRRQIIFEQGGGSNCIIMYIDGGRLYYLVFVSGMSMPKFVSTPISANTIYHATLDYDTLSSSLTGYLYSTNIGSVSGVTQLGNHGGAGIGGSNGNKVRFHDSSTVTASTQFEGIISEIIYYNNATDVGTISSVHNYLADKYASDPVIVSLSAESSTVSEAGGDSTNFIITKSRPQSFDVTVGLSISGSATSGVDYQSIPSSVVIPAFSTSVSVALVPIDDAELETGGEDITITLSASPDYDLGQDNSTVSIIDDESGAPIGDYVMWLNADFGVQLVGTSVNGWVDQSSYLQTVSQATVNNQPTFNPTGIAGRNSVSFDGVNDWLAVTSSDQINLTTQNAKSIGAVFETSTDITTRQVIYEQGGGSRGLALYLDQGNLYFHVWGTGTGDYFLNTPVTPSTSYRVLASFNSFTGDIKLTINDVETVSNVGVGVLNKHSGAAGIGRQNGKLKFHDGVTTGNYPFSGQIADLILYNSELTPVERSSLLLFYGLNYP